MTSIWLGLRLALTPAARIRTALLVAAATLASFVLLLTLGAGRFELAHATAYRAEMPRLILAVVAAVALPCAVLLATVARLSAAVRDRRLANLRLIGLTPGQTRLVAVAETGVATLAGVGLGWLAFGLVRPFLIYHPLAGRSWDDSFGPTTLDQTIVALGVPALVAVAGLMPTRASARDPLAVARRADRTPPGWWRLAPLGIGAALCTVVVVQGHQTSSEATNRQIGLFFAGVILLGIGMVLVLPVLVRMITRALARRSLGAAPRIAVRRLEAQPAAVARIIGALLIGLFLVTGARYVLVAFESTPQYLVAERNITQQQRIQVETTQRHATSVAAEISRLPDVEDVIDLPVIDNHRWGLSALVATCADLGRLDAAFEGCRDGEPMWLAPDGRTMVESYPGARRLGSVTWGTGDRHRRTLLETSIDLPAASAGDGDGSYDSLSPIYADAIIPPAMVKDLPPNTRHTMLVTGPPGRDLIDQLSGGHYAVQYDDLGEYDFVASMSVIIWTIAAVILGIGLLALAIATIDRAIQRRKEIVALQLVGLGPGVVRRAQLLETAVPLTVGVVIAIGLGALAGATYLTLDESVAMPWAQTWGLVLVAVLGGLVVAGICTLAAAPRLRAEEIRTE